MDFALSTRDKDEKEWRQIYKWVTEELNNKINYYNKYKCG